MDRGLWLLLLIGVLAAGAFGAWRLSQAYPMTAATLLPRATNAEIDMMEQQAGHACRCARQRHERPWQSACYAEFNQTVARYEHEEWSAMCAPISDTVACFTLGNGQQRCITRDWGGDACSLEEARTLEAIYAEDQAHPIPGRDRWTETVQSFIRGERVRAPRQSRGGCSG